MYVQDAKRDLKLKKNYTTHFMEEHDCLLKAIFLTTIGGNRKELKKLEKLDRVSRANA